MAAWSLNHWSTREVPGNQFSKQWFCPINILAETLIIPQGLVIFLITGITFWPSSYGIIPSSLPTVSLILTIKNYSSPPQIGDITLWTFFFRLLQLINNVVIVSGAKQWLRHTYACIQCLLTNTSPDPTHKHRALFRNSNRSQCRGSDRKDSNGCHISHPKGTQTQEEGQRGISLSRWEWWQGV